MYYYGARYLDPKYSRWLSTDPALGEYVSGTSSGEGGIYNHVNLNLYHYGGNNPIKYTDPNGEILVLAIPAAAVVAAKAAAWFVGSLAICAVGGYVIGKTAENAVEYAKSKDSENPEAEPADKPSPMPKSGHLEGKDKGNKGQTADPPGEYPGDDPTKPPEGYEWRGKPGSQPGGKDGSYYDPGTGEVLRPDLDHPEGIDPHWDYKDPSGNWWRWFPGD